MPDQALGLEESPFRDPCRRGQYVFGDTERNVVDVDFLPDERGFSVANPELMS